MNNTRIKLFICLVVSTGFSLACISSHKETFFFPSDSLFDHIDTCLTGITPCFSAHSQSQNAFPILLGKCKLGF